MISDFESDVALRKATGWVITLSICLILLGLLAIIVPGVASAFFASIIGWIVLASGIVMIIQSFQSRLVRGFWLNLIVGIFYAIAGIYILFNLGTALLVLTFAIGILFIFEGTYTTSWRLLTGQETRCPGW
jgi:uncharacterized membrane protein HdeD (DUF308 family)